MLASALMIRFSLELCLLAVAAWIPFKLVGGFWGLAIGTSAALLLMLIWGTLLSPKRQVEIGGVPRVVLELALFAVAGAALKSTGHWQLAVALVGGALIDKSTLVALERRL